MRELRTRPQSGDDRRESLRWLRVVIPIAALLVILFWVILVFMNEGFWDFLGNRHLPVAKPRHGLIDHGRAILIAIDRAGRISIADRNLATQELAVVVDGARKEYGGDSYPHVDIRADARTLWHKVLPVLTVLRNAGYSRTSFSTQTADGLPSSIDTRIDALPTDTEIRISRAGAALSLNDTPCTMKTLQSVTTRLGEHDRDTSASFVNDPNGSVQDAVDILSLCYEARLTVHLADTTNANVQQGPQAQ